MSHRQQVYLWHVQKIQVVDHFRYTTGELGATMDWLLASMISIFSRIVKRGIAVAAIAHPEGHQGQQTGEKSPLPGNFWDFLDRRPLHCRVKKRNSNIEIKIQSLSCIFCGLSRGEIRLGLKILSNFKLKGVHLQNFS